MRNLLKRTIRVMLSRARRVIIPVTNFVLPYLPARIVLEIVYLAQALNLPGQHTLLAHLISSISAQNKSKPIEALIQEQKRRPAASCRILAALGRHQDAVKAIQELKPDARTTAMTELMARALFELGEFERARNLLTNSGGREAFDFDASVAHLRGLLELCAGNESDADMALLAATGGMRHLLVPHQNLAARDPSDYIPTQLDFIAGRDGRLFDAYNYLGQRVTHVGMGQLSTDLYAKALKAQKQLSKSTPPISPACLSYIEDLGISLPDLKIFGSEWQTQIGHEGMLDAQLRMRELGWWKGEPIMLVNSGRVANLAFLSLFEHHVKFLSVGGRVPSSIARELFSLQRYYGISFNAFEMPNGTVVQWSEAAALALRQWNEEGRPPPLRAEFDRKFKFNEILAESFEQAKQSWGMRPDDWYVCLHMRDGAFYGEAKGLGQSHRNSTVENYRAAIEFITGLGGWVIKLGAKDSPSLPPTPRVIDYARSDFKSSLMDLALIRNAELFIGTTSGLTNVAISFGVPAALVNCISTDAQLWHHQVRFAPKQIILETGGVVPQTDLTRCPWRWRMFDASVLARHGATPIDNTSDEIIETVKEVLAMASGKLDEYVVGVGAADDLSSRWQASLSMPHFYGGALISLYYLNKHQNSIFSSASEGGKTFANHATGASIEH